MIYDQPLVDKLCDIPTQEFTGIVYRATTVAANPMAPSISGGRWGPPGNGESGIQVLYTAFEKDGALAEVASFLAAQTPIPGPRAIKLTRLKISTRKTVTLPIPVLEGLGVDMMRYGERDYPVTQRIGSALVFLGIDGLIARSARWQCDNLMVLSDNHSLTETLECVDHEEIEWQTWARKNGMIA